MKPQALDLRHQGQQPAYGLPEAGLPRQIMAIGSDVDARQDEFAVALVGQQPGLFDDLAKRQ